MLSLKMNTCDGTARSDGNGRGTAITTSCTAVGEPASGLAVSRPACFYFTMQVGKRLLYKVYVFIKYITGKRHSDYKVNTVKSTLLFPLGRFNFDPFALNLRQLHC